MKFSATTLTLAAIPTVFSARLGAENAADKASEKPAKTTEDKMAKLEEKNADLERKLDALLGKMSEQQTLMNKQKNDKMTGYLKNPTNEKTRRQKNRQLSGSKKYYGSANTKQVCYSDDTPQLDEGVGAVSGLNGDFNLGGLEFGIFDVYEKYPDDIMIEMTMTSLIAMFQAGAWVEDHTFIPGVESLVLPFSPTHPNNQAGPYQLGGFAGAFVSPMISKCDDIPQGNPYKCDYYGENCVETGYCGWAGYPDEYPDFSYHECAYKYCQEHNTLLNVDVQPAPALPINAELWYNSEAIIDTAGFNHQIKAKWQHQFKAETSTLKFFIPSTEIEEPGAYKIDFVFYLEAGAYRWQVFSGIPTDPVLGEPDIVGGAPGELFPNESGFAGSYIALGPHIIEVSKIFAKDKVCNTEDDFDALDLPEPDFNGGLFGPQAGLPPGGAAAGAAGLGLAGPALDAMGAGGGVAPPGGLPLVGVPP